MMKFLFLTAMLFSTTANAVKIPCKMKLPIILNGCQGEGCTSVAYFVLDQDVDAVKDIQSKTVLQQIKKGTKIKRPFNYFIEVRRPGIYRVMDKTIEQGNSKYTLKRGTAFEVLYDIDGVHYSVCIENEAVTLKLKDNFEVLEPVKADDWIKFKLDSKTNAFIKRSDVKVISSE